MSKALGGPSSAKIDARQQTTLKRDDWFIALAISPDGRQLAYLKSGRSPGDRERKEHPSVVEVMPANGGPARQVFRDPVWLSGARYNTLTWSHDGRHLLFVRDDGRLWRAPVEGGAPQQVGIHADETDARVLGDAKQIKSPAVHPDGSRVAFAMAELDDSEILTLENFLPVGASN